MIHAFAIDPRLAASWSRLTEFRFVSDKFGLGTPRVMLELPEFTEWKNAVYTEAASLELGATDWSRLEELFKLFAEHRCRRADAVYQDLVTWLENAENEYDRREFAAILATENPRRHSAVVLGDELGAPKARRWIHSSGATPERTPEGLATALTGILVNARVLHLVDPHFGPQRKRNRLVLEGFFDVLARNGLVLDLIRVHCMYKEEYPLPEFEEAAREMAARLPQTAAVEFVRWKQREHDEDGERLHNRYVLSDLGGVSLGIGLDAGAPGETDDLLLMTREQYRLRWSQYADEDGTFAKVDSPALVRGARRSRR